MLVVVSARLILVVIENLTTYDSQETDHEELSDPWKDSITSYVLHCFTSL
jgi:hypothetical protein